LHKIVIARRVRIRITLLTIDNYFQEACVEAVHGKAASRRSRSDHPNIAVGDEETPSGGGNSGAFPEKEPTRREFALARSAQDIDQRIFPLDCLRRLDHEVAPAKRHAS
jgi:hypothetical protein